MPRPTARGCRPIKVVDFEKLWIWKPGFPTADASERYSARPGDHILVVLKAPGCPFESHWLWIGGGFFPTFLGYPMHDHIRFTGVIRTKPVIYTAFKRGQELSVLPRHVVAIVRQGTPKLQAEMDAKRRFNDLQLMSHFSPTTMRDHRRARQSMVPL